MARQLAPQQGSLRHASWMGVTDRLRRQIVTSLLRLATMFEWLSAQLGGSTPDRPTRALIVDEAGAIDRELRALCATAIAPTGTAVIHSNTEWARAKLAVGSAGDRSSHNHRITTPPQAPPFCECLSASAVNHIGRTPPAARPVLVRSPKGTRGGTGSRLPAAIAIRGDVLTIATRSQTTHRLMNRVLTPVRTAGTASNSHIMCIVSRPAHIDVRVATSASAA